MESNLACHCRRTDRKLLIADSRLKSSRAQEVCGKTTLPFNNQESEFNDFSRSPSSSDKSHIADTSACNGSRAAGLNNSGNTALGLVEPRCDRPVSLPAHGRVHSRLPAIVVHSCPPTVLLSHRQRKCDFRYSMREVLIKLMPRGRLPLRWSGSRTQPRATMRLNAATLGCISRAPESACRPTCGSQPKTVPVPLRDPRSARFG